jgi:16S rRNA (guanine966-N2)-methyltransferase
MGGKHSEKSGQLRIIGGSWRGRRLLFPASPGLRPTPDRVRETLFNWLAPVIRGARCLDLFSGSGALGLEALSRGADYCIFIDSVKANTLSLEQHLRTLDCEAGQTHCGDTLRWLTENPALPADIVFLDPPFGQSLLNPTCALLETAGWLAPGAHIYLESGRREPVPEVPGDWQLKREKQAGEVRYQLFVRPE